MQTTRDLTVLVIDENAGISPLLAQRLSRIRGIRVVGETANVMLGAELAHQLEPDVILADFRRTGPPRAETYRWLGRLSPGSVIVAHTTYFGSGEGHALREAGVAGCLLKGTSVPRLAEQIVELACLRNGHTLTNPGQPRESRHDGS